ncbi:histidine kinase [Paenibacillus dendritiformis]|uniref:sensor histidine kinase n=1 Tax=Paenibacillus dendritiformis TaxID=130049 RepID=UPI0018CDA383|nr:HAMP domain-containing sensor histidine kinase [Paenibacillus dendritiformis]MBG9794055.1 histidine kinase [Paenibacillus dendritiformis]
MDDVIRIIRRFTGITFAIFAGMIVLNAVMLSLFIFKEINSGHSPQSVLEYVADHLRRKDGSYELHGRAEELLAENQAWGMLLNPDGDVIWEHRLPEEVPRSYTLTEVAKFSRHYLQGYPVFVWEVPDGLVVIGYPKNSYAKYQFSFLASWVSSLPKRTLFLLLGNIALGCMLSIIIGTRLAQSLKPLAGVVHALGKEEAVHVEEKGIFGHLAKSINDTAEMLQEKHVALRARNEARSNWIAGISHDIRTPLSMILGYASALEENEAVSEEQRQQAAIIRQQGEKLRSLVNDLNLVSKLEYDMQPLNVKPTRLSALARQIAADYLNHGLDERFTIEVKVMDENIQVEADQKLLLRAVTNLVQNSIDHNPAGCVIKLIVRRESGHGTCQFIVADNGGGIPRRELANVVELLYTSTRPDPLPNGHGLGLPMVARIAQAHGGRLVLDSDTGQGVRAMIELSSYGSAGEG